MNSLNWPTVISVVANSNSATATTALADVPARMAAVPDANRTMLKPALLAVPSTLAGAEAAALASISAMARLYRSLAVIRSRSPGGTDDANAISIAGSAAISEESLPTSAPIDTGDTVALPPYAMQTALAASLTDWAFDAYDRAAPARPALDASWSGAMDAATAASDRGRGTWYASLGVPTSAHAAKSAMPAAI